MSIQLLMSQMYHLHFWEDKSQYIWSNNRKESPNAPDNTRVLTSSGQMINLKLSRSSGSGNSVPHVFGRLSSFMSEKGTPEMRDVAAWTRRYKIPNLLWFSAAPRTPSSGCQPWVTRHLFSPVSTRIIWS